LLGGYGEHAADQSERAAIGHAVDIARMHVVLVAVALDQHRAADEVYDRSCLGVHPLRAPIAGPGLEGTMERPVAAPVGQVDRLVPDRLHYEPSLLFVRTDLAL